MTQWYRLDTGFAQHRKVRRLTDAAFRLHVAAMCRVGKDETDGRITPEDLEDAAADARQPERKVDGLVAELVSRGLWAADDDGWVVHDWLDLNPSHADLEAEREANRTRAQNWRRRKAAAKADQDDDPGPDEPPDDEGTYSDRNGVTNGVTHGVTHALVTERRNGTERNGTRRTTGSPSSRTEPKRIGDALGELGLTPPRRGTRG